MAKRERRAKQMTEYEVHDIEHMTQSDILNIIMPGDVVRFTGPGEHDITTRRVTDDNGAVVVLGECTYTLRGLSEDRGNSIEITGVLRPIPGLPTVPGYYEGAVYPLSEGRAAYRLKENGSWYVGDLTVGEDTVRRAMPLTRLVPDTAPSKLVDRLDLGLVGRVMERITENGYSTYDVDGKALIAAIDNGEFDK